MNTLDTFWSRVDKTTLDSCWVWMGCTNNYGYGFFKYHNKIQQAHRLSYKTLVGPIPVGLCVCHRCDNPLCVNPDHLFLGTPRDNQNDRRSKQRDNDTGPKHPKSYSKEVIHRYFSGEKNQRELAEIYGTSINNIYKIIKRFRGVDLSPIPAETHPAEQV